MFRNRLYYRLKPLLPASLRLAVRRWFAVRKREQVLGTWPILPGSEKPPENWVGWPDGKQFAFVLTHDVEGQSGLDKCRQLMELEMKFGFRSSFNFIPEGDYKVPRALIDDLKANGFEVGIHDLHHDGKLYSNRQDFAQKAVRINQYLKDWGAVGFRSGFMLHNLEWLHDLEVAYDASTFDTDPFEPQPDGVNTIFPFWVEKQKVESREQKADLTSGLPASGASRSGYVELPYTLPQDSTLFLLFRERHPDIWFQKLDWIARHGGMAVLPVHPDYMNFKGPGRSGHDYSHKLYIDFLEYIRDKFQGRYWHATPSEVSKWYASHIRSSAPCPPDPARNRSQLRGKRAAVVLYSYYPSDPRPRREAEALASAGVEVDVICLRQNNQELARETINGVNLRRVAIPRRRDGKLTYLLQYGAFLGFSSMVLAFRTLRKKYDLVHAHNMPDVLVFSGLIPKLRGARVVLDLHDPMPELMMTIFGLKEHSSIIKLLKAVEKLCIGFADRIFTVNMACKRIFSSRSCAAKKISVVMNAPDEQIFGFHEVNNRTLTEAPKRFVIMYHGSIVERHGLDLAFRALEIVKQRIPSAELRIYGSRTPFLDSILAPAQNNGLRDAVKYFGPKSLEEIVQAIEECEVGIIPNRRSIFTEINTPTRIFEYLSRGKPVIAPSAPGIQDYFGQEELLYFQLGDADDLARKLEYVYANPGDVKEVVKRGQSVYLAHSWRREKEVFLDTVCDVLRDRSNQPLPK